MREKAKFGYLSVIVIIQPEQPKCPKQVQPVCMFHFSEMFQAGLVSGRSLDNAFGINARRSLDGRVLRRYSLGLCFTHQSCRRSDSSANSPAVTAGKRCGYGVFRKCITYRSRGANYDGLEGCPDLGGHSTTRCGGLEVGRHGRRLVT